MVIGSCMGNLNNVLAITYIEAHKCKKNSYPKIICKAIHHVSLMFLCVNVIYKLHIPDLQRNIYIYTYIHITHTHRERNTRTEKETHVQRKKNTHMHRRSDTQAGTHTGM